MSVWDGTYTEAFVKGAKAEHDRIIGLLKWRADEASAQLTLPPDEDSTTAFIYAHIVYSLIALIEGQVYDDDLNLPNLPKDEPEQ